MTFNIVGRNSSKNEAVTQKRFAYGLNEIAERTGLSTAFLRKEARAGNLKTKKFGTRVLVLVKDLEAYLERSGEK